MDNAYSVIIAGGGMVGASMALALAQQGFDVQIVDDSPLPTLSDSHVEMRVSAINRATQNFWRRLGVWQDIVTLGLSPYQAMTVWRRSHQQIHFHAKDIGQPDLGCIVENDVIRQALISHLNKHERVRWHNERIEQVSSIGPNGVAVRTASQQLNAALIIAADGANSSIRTQLNIPLSMHDYGHHALVATFQAKAHLDTAWQRFLSDGPLALLPLRDNRCSMVWSLPPEASKNIMALSPERRCEVVAQHMDFRVGELVQLTDTYQFPLTMRQSRQYVGDGWALVGDAAHTIHPLAGQGVNMGIMDVAALTHVLTEIKLRGRAIEHKQALHPYQRWRRSENRIMAKAMAFFKDGFSHPVPFIPEVLGSGMGLLDSIRPVKNKVIKQAMGLAGNIPASCRQLGLGG
jgi:2-octaprenylphenol hydroxylase